MVTAAAVTGELGTIELRSYRVGTAGHGSHKPEDWDGRGYSDSSEYVHLHILRNSARPCFLNIYEALSRMGCNDGEVARILTKKKKKKNGAGVVVANYCACQFYYSGKLCTVESSVYGIRYYFGNSKKFRSFEAMKKVIKQS